MKNKAWKHFKLITKHRWIVFKLSIKAGIPWRGFVHDLSKYSIIEFFEGAKYYIGTRSPITVAREERQFSKAWLHHKGHNKHHEEYWYDWNAPIKAPVIPYKYTVEMLCDCISAGMVYKGDEWNREHPLKYWQEVKNKELFHPKMINFFESVYRQIKDEGIDKTITRENLKRKYERYCIK